MSTPDFFRARLGVMVDPRHALVVLEKRLPWAAMESVPGEGLGLWPNAACKATPSGSNG